MISKPIEPNIEDAVESNEQNSYIPKQDSCYGYNDNVTLKLGGNYAKIIEFYDNHL